MSNFKIFLVIFSLCLPAIGQSNLTLIGVGSAVASAGTTVTFNTTANALDTSGTTNLVLSLNFTPAGIATGNYVGMGIGFQGVTATVSTVCDGTGTDQCTGGSTYSNNSHAVIRNSTNSYQYWFTCNYQGTPANGLTVRLSGSSTFLYVAYVVATGNSTSGSTCDDGYSSNSATSGTAYTTGATATTTNTHDMFAGFFMNDTSGTYTAGTDGQGNTMTIRANDSGVNAVETFNESAKAAYNASMTGPSVHWEAIGAAVK